MKYRVSGAPDAAALCGLLELGKPKRGRAAFHAPMGAVRHLAINRPAPIERSQKCPQPLSASQGRQQGFNDR